MKTFINFSFIGRGILLFPLLGTALLLGAGSLTPTPAVKPFFTLSTANQPAKAGTNLFNDISKGAQTTKSESGKRESPDVNSMFANKCAQYPNLSCDPETGKVWDPNLRQWVAPDKLTVNTSPSGNTFPSNKDANDAIKGIK
jgi:hypothetical protein